MYRRYIVYYQIVSLSLHAWGLPTGTCPCCACVSACVYIQTFLATSIPPRSSRGSVMKRGEKHHVSKNSFGETKVYFQEKPWKIAKSSRRYNYYRDKPHSSVKHEPHRFQSIQECEYKPTKHKRGEEKEISNQTRRMRCPFFTSLLFFALMHMLIVLLYKNENFTKRKPGTKHKRLIQQNSLQQEELQNIQKKCHK